MTTPDGTAREMWRTLSQYLNGLGLGALLETDAHGNPGGWLWEQVQNGIDTREELEIRIQGTTAFRERFSVIIDQQRRAAAGEPVYVMSTQEVLDYERFATQEMSAAGIPAWFYDEPDDFAKLMKNDISPDELRNRITEAYDYVKAAPPEVRNAFRDYYGVAQGDGALAAWALDPNRTVRDVKKATRTAYAKGMADRFDISIDRRTATRLADLPMTEEGITTGLRTVASQENLRQGTFGDTSLTDQQGVAAVFEGDADVQRELDVRLAERRAQNTAGAGGAFVDQSGVRGSGIA